MPTITSKSGTITAKKNGTWKEVTSTPYDLSNVSEVDCDSTDSWCRITIGEGHITHLSNSLLATSKCIITQGSYYYYPRQYGGYPKRYSYV